MSGEIPVPEGAENQKALPESVRERSVIALDAQIQEIETYLEMLKDRRNNPDNPDFEIAPMETGWRSSGPAPVKRAQEAVYKHDLLKDAVQEAIDKGVDYEGLTTRREVKGAIRAEEEKRVSE